MQQDDTKFQSIADELVATIAPKVSESRHQYVEISAKTAACQKAFTALIMDFTTLNLKSPKCTLTASDQLANFLRNSEV